VCASLDLAAKPQLRLTELIAALSRNAVDFVVIGGVAAQLHRLPMPATIDLDITPSRSPKNLARLAKVFDEIDAALATAGENGTWFPRHPISNWAQYDMIHLVTKFGLLDLVFAPEGSGDGFNELIRESQELQLGDQTVRVISVNTWERLKLATKRDKDIFHLLLLARHRDKRE